MPWSARYSAMRWRTSKSEIDSSFTVATMELESLGLESEVASITAPLLFLASCTAGARSAVAPDALGGASASSVFAGTAFDSTAGDGAPDGVMAACRTSEFGADFRED